MLGKIDNKCFIDVYCYKVVLRWICFFVSLSSKWMIGFIIFFFVFILYILDIWVNVMFYDRVLFVIIC